MVRELTAIAQISQARSPLELGAPPFTRVKYVDNLKVCPNRHLFVWKSCRDYWYVHAGHMTRPPSRMVRVLFKSCDKFQTPHCTCRLARHHPRIVAHFDGAVDSNSRRDFEPAIKDLHPIE